ncbi:hypothetical protein MHAE_07783 [Mycobacterium haemophilum DSM 44634]|nr:hypothetical protein B586_03235 [Mycobacterium haemophilum DSM 44634]
MAYAFSQTLDSSQRSAVTSTPTRTQQKSSPATGDLDEIVADYTDDSVIITAAGVSRGKVGRRFSGQPR